MNNLAFRLKLFKWVYGYPIKDMIKRVRESDDDFLKSVVSRKSKLGGAALVQARLAEKQLERRNNAFQ